jgi:carbon starvation protein CstA
MIEKNGPGGVVSDVANGYLGDVGGMAAVLAVILLSITSGDTAFRSARLTVGDYWQKENQSLKKRLLISAVVLSGGIAMSFFDLTTIWTYFGWANQCLATITLWTATFYLKKQDKCFWLTLVPAGFMSSICVAYILYDKIGFRLPLSWSAPIGITVAVMLVIWFLVVHKKTNKA